MPKCCICHALFKEGQNYVKTIDGRYMHRICFLTERGWV